MATRKTKSASAKKRDYVSASVRIDAPTNARLAAAAALAGVDKSTYIYRAVLAALEGIVVFDRNAVKSPGQVTPVTLVDSASDAA